MENLRLLREDVGLSQQKLADSIAKDLTQQKIYQYENGIYEPDISTLKALADFFSTSIDYIVGHTDIRRKIEEVEEYALNGEEKKLVDRFRRLPPNHRETVFMFLDTLNKE